MNQPTEDRIKKLEERMTRLEQQRTEEMKAINVNVASQDVTDRLKALEEDTAVLKIEMQGARADILQIRESQGDLRDRLVEHGDDLKVIKDKQEAHSELLGQLITIGETTKDDIASIKVTQDGQGKKLDQILKLLESR